jgi:hypothetical protein
MRIVAFYVLLAQVAASTRMPPQPDFSGRWTLVTAIPSDKGVPKALAVRQPVTRTNPRGEPIPPFFFSIEIQRQIETATITETHWIGVIGGTVGGIVNLAGGTGPIPPRVNSHYAVTWEGPMLVFELGTSTADTPGTGDWTGRRETWALQPNGELAIDVATSSSADRARTVSATYRRRD